MQREILGILASFALVLGMLGLSGTLKKRGLLTEEVSRKLTHVLLSNWILVALFFFKEPVSACIVPACFVILNAISHRRGLFSAIERDQNRTLGTVWYAVSLFVLCVVFFGVNMPWIAACGILAMGYGDGLAALIGGKYGRHRFWNRLQAKSLEGTLTTFALSALAVGLVCAVFAPWLVWSAAPVCGVLAAALELYSPSGIDNLTLPIGVSLATWAMALRPDFIPAFICLAVTLCILIAAHYKRSVTFWGMQAATLLGLSLFILSGIWGYAALVLFFALGSAFGKVGGVKKSEAASLHKRRGPRGVVQVAANGAPALIFAALHRFTGEDGLQFAIFVCFCVAAADTLSSELGMLSRREPVSIITLKPVRRGLSGGVTPAGFAAGCLGSAMLSLTVLPVFGICGLVPAVALGVAGSLLDSVLGASLQAKYRLPGDSGLTECVPSKNPPPPERGLSWVDNDVVNFASILACGILSAMVWRLL